MKVDFAKVAGGIAQSLVTEVRRPYKTAFAACGDGSGAHFLAEFDDGDEAVAVRSVPLLCITVRPGSVRGQRTPNGGREADREAGSFVVKRMNDLAGEALETIDLAPRGLPLAELGGKCIGGSRERLEQKSRGGSGSEVGEGEIDGATRAAEADFVSPEDS